MREHNVEALVEAGISRLRAVSVRDQNSYNIVKRFLKSEPTIVCDPVLLYGFQDQQNDEIRSSFCKKQKEKYCIVYSYDYNMNDELTVRSIKEYAKKRNLKIYSVGYYHKWCDSAIQLSPLDVFKWFANAEMVFTDTFHGSVISLTTGTQFISQIRGNANKLSFLLEQYGVSFRKVDDFSHIEEIAATPIDYSVVGQTIIKIREDSMAYLKYALGELNVKD